MRPDNSVLAGTGGERAVSPVVGAVLLLGIAVTALTVYQVNAVPQQNHDVEYDHNRQVQDELTVLRVAIHETASTNRHRSASVKLGTDYPTRTVAVNPPPARGSLASVEFGPDRPVVISNAAEVDADESNGFWNGDDRRYNTSAIVYEPDYAEYTNAPRTVYEHSLLYNRFDGHDAEVVLEDQRLVRDDTLTLYTIAGEYREQGTQRVTVDVEPNSAPMQSVSITNDSDPIRITLPTAYPELWEDALADEMDPDGNVTDVDPNVPEEGNVTITLEPGEYELQLAQAGIDDHEPANESYIVRVGSEEVTEEEPFAAEVRDKFDNPVSGGTVSANVLEGDCNLDSNEEKTDDNGRVEFECEHVTSESEIELSILDNENTWENVTFSVKPTALGGGGGGGGGDGGGGSSPLVYTNGGEPESYGTGQKDVSFEIENTGEESLAITGFIVSEDPAGEDYETYEEYNVVSQVYSGSSGYEVGEFVDHQFFIWSTYPLESGGTVEYELEGFDSNMKNEDFEFVVVAEGDDGNVEHVVDNGSVTIG